MQVRTGGFRGEKAWEAKVYTDDPNSKEFTLAVKAFVKPALTLSSGKVSFYLNKNEVITKTVEIKGELPNPLTLVPSQFNLEGRVTYRIDELEKGKRFRLVFQNVPGQSGTFRGFLRLKTNYTEKPDVLIWIWVQHVDTSQKPPS